MFREERIINILENKIKIGDFLYYMDYKFSEIYSPCKLCNSTGRVKVQGSDEYSLRCPVCKTKQGYDNRKNIMVTKWKLNKIKVEYFAYYGNGKILINNEIDMNTFTKINKNYPQYYVTKEDCETAMQKCIDKERPYIDAFIEAYKNN